MVWCSYKKCLIDYSGNPDLAFRGTEEQGKPPRAEKGRPIVVFNFFYCIYRVGQNKLEHSFLDCNFYNF